MTRVIYSNRFLQDFEEVLHRVELEDPQAAVRLGESIMQICKLFEHNPLMGEARPELGKAIRRFVYRGYGIYDRLGEADSVVMVDRLLHHARNVDRSYF